MLRKLIIFMIVLTLVGCGEKKGTKSGGEKKKNVEIAKVVPQEVTKLNIASGVVEPLNEVKKVTKTGGTVKKINFKNGDKVKKGETILILENQSVHSAYLKAEAEYLFNQTDYKTRENSFKKFEELYKEKLISEEEYLAKKNNYVQGLSNLKTSEANYLSAKENYEDLVVKSEIDGVITDLDMKIYEEIPANKDLLSVIDNEKMIVRTMVSVQEIDGVEIGNKVKVKLEGLQEEYTGKVIEVNPSADDISKKYLVKIELDNKNGKIKKGMFGKVSLETGKREGYVVPKEAIVIKELYSYIFVVENGEARSIRIERGYTNESLQEIISDELYSDMQVVVKGQLILEDKDKVNIVE